MHTIENLVRFAKDWDIAMTGNDPEYIGSFMSDDWVIVGTDSGIVSKKEFLQNIISGDLTHSRMDADEWRTKIYNDTGIVTCRGVSAGKYKGHEFELYEWSNSVFIWEEDRGWRCVHTMLTPVEKA